VERRHLRFWKPCRPNRPGRSSSTISPKAIRNWPRIVRFSVVGWKSDTILKSRLVHSCRRLRRYAGNSEGMGWAAPDAVQTPDAARAFGLHRVELTVRKINERDQLYKKIV
jgi:hypothetical protein